MKKIVWFVIVMVNNALVFAQHKSAQPNIIIIMADDLGYSDLGCFGGEINTPNLDKLAMNGLRMTNFYNNARCCPTRASLLTGQYAHKVGLANNGNALTYNGATLAELLKSNGYQTGMVGKWHLSDDIQKPSKEDQLRWLNHQAFTKDDFASRASYPINRGFQKHYGVIWGVVNYFDPFSLVNGEEPVATVPDNYYITDAINDTTVAYINQFTAAQKPFFLYVAHTAPHWPIQAKPEDIAKYEGKYTMGWDKLREQRYKRMVKLGIVDESITKPIPVMGQLGSWDALPKDEQLHQAKKMAVHAAMVDHVDQGVGKLVAALTASQSLENTLIIFLSDNGASPEIPRVPGYDRPSATRNGVPLQYADAMEVKDIGSQTTYTGIGSNWANAANTPWRFWKMESFEGGVHTPVIVHWPAGLKTKPGSISNELGHVTDIVPTFLDIAAMQYPTQYNGHSLTALDGVSFLPVLTGKAKSQRNAIFFEHANGKAYIKDNWKLVMRSSAADWELYDLSKDRNETQNIASENATQFAEMKNAWDTWYALMKPYIKPRPGSGPK